MTIDNKTKAKKAAAPHTPTVAMIALKNLLPAATNVRKGPLVNIEGLATSILETGLQQSLKVEPADKGTFRVINGSRRYAALQHLLKAGSIKDQYEVPCIVEADELVSKDEQQLVENMERCALNPVDEYEAFAKIIADESATPADLAKRFSTTERHIKQRMRLGTLADPIRESLREGKITLDVAKQFAAVADKERQQNVFQVISETRNLQYVQPWQVRQMITEASYEANHPLVQFITVEAYEEKGGQADDDLFQDVTRLTDGALVEAMALAKLQKIADEICQKEAWGWGDATLEDPNSFGHSDLRINSYTRALTEEEQNEYQTITDKLLDMEDDDLTPEQLTEYNALEERLDEITQLATSYNAAEKAIAGVRVSVTDDGQPNISRGWVKEDDIKRLEVLRETGAEKKKAAKKEPAKKPLNALLVEDLTAERTYAARLALLANPQYAVDLALFSLARAVESQTSGALFMPITPASVGTSGKHTIAAQATIGKARGQLNKSWCDKPYMESFELFRALTDDEKNAWAAFAMQRQINGTANWSWDGGKPTDFDQFAAFLGADIRASFTPDADFFQRYTKDQLLDVAEQVGGGSFRNYMVSLKKGDMVSAIAGVFDGTVDDYGQEAIEKAKTWLPSKMDFPKQKTKKMAKKSASKATAKKAATKSASRGKARATKAVTDAKKAKPQAKKQPVAKAA